MRNGGHAVKAVRFGSSVNRNQFKPNQSSPWNSHLQFPIVSSLRSLYYILVYFQIMECLAQYDSLIAQHVGVFSAWGV